MLDKATINSLLGIQNTRGDRCQHQELPAVQALGQDILITCCVPGAQWVTETSRNLLRLYRRDLNTVARLWYAFIHSNLSCVPHESDITAASTRLLYAILAKKTIDVGSVIAMDI